MSRAFLKTTVSILAGFCMVSCRHKKLNGKTPDINGTVGETFTLPIHHTWNIANRDTTTRPTGRRNRFPTRFFHSGHVRRKRGVRKIQSPSGKQPDTRISFGHRISGCLRRESITQPETTAHSRNPHSRIREKTALQITIKKTNYYVDKLGRQVRNHPV